jgi:hypothetical protein
MNVLAALTWPEAIVRVTWIAAAAAVVAVLVWSIFRTGRTAISSESGTDRLRAEVRDLRAQVDRLSATST